MGDGEGSTMANEKASPGCSIFFWAVAVIVVGVLVIAVMMGGYAG